MTEPVPTTQDHPSGSFLPPEWEQLAAEFARQRDEARAEVSRLTSALSTAERARAQLKSTIDAFPEAHIAANLAHAREQRDKYVDMYKAAEQRAERAEAELERTREVVEAATRLVDAGIQDRHSLFLDLRAEVDALRTDKEGADGT